MKKFLLLFCILAFSLYGCKKGGELTSCHEPQKPVIEKPSALFKINNLVSNDMILEGNITDFDNKSLNADSYDWDFGNGNHSTEMVPRDISFAPCGGEYTISLTVKNKAGEANYAQTFTILCRGRNAGNGRTAHHHAPLNIVHLNAPQIAASGYGKKPA